MKTLEQPANEASAQTAAIEVIKAHIAQKKSELALVNERAKTEVA